MIFPVCFLDRVNSVGWGEWVVWVGLLGWGVNVPLLTRLPTRFPFMSVAPVLSTSAQTLQCGGLVSLQHHSRSAVGSQL